MNTQQAYNSWASQYDTNENKTRDLEARALRGTLADVTVSACLEIGCGTGKNTEWLQTKAASITAVDLSEEMLAKARTKIKNETVEFVQADINQDWHFSKKPYDLVTFSLVLEHIENLDDVFQKGASALQAEGLMYIGELHPFKQYNGSKARFDTEEGTQIVPCFTHHSSDFTEAANKHGLQLINLKEYFDDATKESIPRILVLLFKKK